MTSEKTEHFQVVWVYTQNLWKYEVRLEERTDSGEGKYEGRMSVSEKQTSHFQETSV